MVITYGHCRSLARVNACLMVSYCWCVFNGYQNNLQLEEVGICWIHCVHMNKWQIWNSHINNQVMKIYTYILKIIWVQFVTHIDTCRKYVDIVHWFILTEGNVLHNIYVYWYMCTSIRMMLLTNTTWNLSWELIHEHVQLY